jgi:scyllo-inositol 2-dehydrogenase (NADP+)
MSAIRTVIVGWGRWGRLCHGLMATSTPGMELAGIVSSSSDKRQDAADRHGCDGFATLDEALNVKPELVVLATPPDVNVELAGTAMRAGADVLVDKPIAPDLARADTMIGTAAETGRRVCVFQNRRYDGDFNTLRGLIRDGRLGELKWVEMAWQAFGPPRGWRGEADRGGGRFRDLGAHLIDQMLLLFPGRIEGVYARLLRDFDGRDIESEAMLVLHFEGNRTGVVDCSSLSTLPKPRFYARGTGGTFEKYGVDPQEAKLADGIEAVRAAREPESAWGRLRAATDGKLEGRPEDAPRIETQPGDWPGFYTDLRDALKTGSDLPAPAADARRVVAVFEAAERSARSGRVEAVDGE